MIVMKKTQNGVDYMGILSKFKKNNRVVINPNINPELKKKHSMQW